MSIDHETVQKLLDLLNPLHGSLDKQVTEIKDEIGTDLLPDYEHGVIVTEQMERDLTAAVVILERLLRKVERK